MNAEPIVYVVDDDTAARESVAALVTSKGAQVKTSSSAEEFLENLDPANVGCLVVDVRMAGMSGLDLQAELKNRQIDLPIIIITGFGDIPTAVRAMKAGALTFLEKPCRADELWAAIQHAQQHANTRQTDDKQLSEVKARLNLLTDDERKIIPLILSGKTNKAIAAELDMGLRTVEFRRASVMRKMEAGSFADLVRLLVHAGEWMDNA